MMRIYVLSPPPNSGGNSNVKYHEFTTYSFYRALELSPRACDNEVGSKYPDPSQQSTGSRCDPSADDSKLFEVCMTGPVWIAKQMSIFRRRARSGWQAKLRSYRAALHKLSRDLDHRMHVGLGARLECDLVQRAIQHPITSRKLL